VNENTHYSVPGHLYKMTNRWRTAVKTQQVSVSRDVHPFLNARRSPF